jgi:DNA polymerase III alpha subunit
MYNILPLFKTHYSLGKSILTLEKPTGKPDVYPITVFDLLIENKLNTLVLVEDNISGLLQASKQCDEKNITLIFGLRIDVNEDISIKDEASLKKRAKYIVFCKNSEGYKTLIKIWSIAARQGFYYTPCMDFKTLKSLWNENLILTVPFYDSFLELNLLNSHVHVPDLDGLGKVMFLTESNDLPFDDLLSSKVNNYCQNRHNIIKAQSKK